MERDLSIHWKKVHKINKGVMDFRIIDKLNTLVTLETDSLSCSTLAIYEPETDTEKQLLKYLLARVNEIDNLRKAYRGFTNALKNL